MEAASPWYRAYFGFLCGSALFAGTPRTRTNDIGSKTIRFICSGMVSAPVPLETLWQQQFIPWYMTARAAQSVGPSRKRNLVRYGLDDLRFLEALCNGIESQSGPKPSRSFFQSGGASFRFKCIVLPHMLSSQPSGPQNSFELRSRMDPARCEEKWCN